MLSNHGDSNCLQSSPLSHHKSDNSVMISTSPTMTQLESIASLALHSVHDSCYPAPLTVYHLDSPSLLPTDHHDSLTPSNMQISQKLQSILPSDNQPDSPTLSISSTISQPDSVKYIPLNDMHIDPPIVSNTQVERTDYQKQLKVPTDCKEVETLPPPNSPSPREVKKITLKRKKPCKKKESPKKSKVQLIFYIHVYVCSFSISHYSYTTTLHRLSCNYISVMNVGKFLSTRAVFHVISIMNMKMKHIWDQISCVASVKPSM